MEPNTEEVLNAFLTKVVNSLESGMDIASEQMPFVLEELIAWKLVSSGLFTGIGVLLVAVAGVLIKNLLTPDDYFDVDKTFTLILCTVFSGILGILFTAINLPEFLQVLVAPRVYLIEYTSSLIK